MAGEEQERAAAVGARLAAESAADFKDISEAMQIAASAASQMGLSYDSLAAIIATVRDTTQQSASVIGNAYKTILSRFEQLTVSGTDGEVTLGQVSSKLAALGVSALDAAGNLRPVEDIIMQIGNAWDTYSQKQQLALAEIAGGTRQYGQFLALFQNFDKFLKLRDSAVSETGSTLTQQYETAIDTVTNYAINAREAWSEAFSAIFTEDALKGFFSTLEGIGDVVDSIIESFHGLQGIMQIVMIGMIRKAIPAV